MDLVERLDNDAGAPAMEGDPDAMVVLWAGTRDYTRQAIERALNAAKIQYEEDGVESQLMPASRDTISRILVRRGDFRAAVAAIQNIDRGDSIVAQAVATARSGTSSLLGLLGAYQGYLGPVAAPKTPAKNFEVGDENSAEVAPPEPSDAESPEPPEFDSLENFYPEDATLEIWSGEEADMPGNIKMCLNEIGIGCVLSEDSGKHRVMVLPADETRAREIVREIVEATPPE